MYALRSHLELDEPLDSVAALDDAELFTTGGFSTTTGFCFGGRPFGLGAGFVFAGGVFFRGSSSLSVEFSGEKILFIFFDLLAAAAAAFIALLVFALAGADLMFPLPCICCCCLTMDGGALPPIDGTVDDAFFDLIFDADANVFFLISFCTRFASVCCALVGGVSSSSVE